MSYWIVENGNEQYLAVISMLRERADEVEPPDETFQLQVWGHPQPVGATPNFLGKSNVARVRLLQLHSVEPCECNSSCTDDEMS